jgi:hypothetical protein
MPLIFGTNSIKDTGYNVDNSLRFNDGSSDNLSGTLSSGSGSDVKGTISLWVKRSHLGTNQAIICGKKANTERVTIGFSSENRFEIQFQDTSNAYNWRSNALYRDISAWYSCIIKLDTANGTATSRARVWINNEEITSWNIQETVPQNLKIGFFNNTNTRLVGARGGSSTDKFFDGYIAEVVGINNALSDNTDFIEVDEDSGIIKPKAVSGLTFGTNGFYLPFENSGALGQDDSGNGNNFTVNNLTAIDQSTDTCTNNYSTINSLDNYFYNATLSEGNLKQTCNPSNYSFGTSTFGVSQGKWVVEVKIESGSTVRNVLGITDKVSTGSTNELGSLANAWQYSPNGQIYNNGSLIDTYSTYTTNDIIGIYLDLDNNKLYFSKNGTVQNSGTGISITAPSSTTNGVYFFAFGDYGASDDSVNNVNFGSPAFSISSGNTDGEYGNFEYTTTITGDSASKTFKALNTKNLAEYG